MLTKHVQDKVFFCDKSCFIFILFYFLFMDGDKKKNLLFVTNNDDDHQCNPY